MAERMDMKLHKTIRSLFSPEKGTGIYVEILSVSPLRYKAKIFTDEDAFYTLTQSMFRTDKTFFVFDRMSKKEVFCYNTKRNLLEQDYTTHETLCFRTRLEKVYSSEAVLLEFAQLRTVIEAELTKTLQ